MEGTGRVRIHPRGARQEARLKTPRRIGILGHVGNGNLGDEAIIDALIRGIREVVPGVEFAAFTIRPGDTEARHGIPSFPLRRGRQSGPAGASAPEVLVDELLGALKRLGAASVRKLDGVHEDVVFPMPMGLGHVTI